MKNNQEKENKQSSIVDPIYATGKYFEDPCRYSLDSPLKAKDFLKLFRKCFKDKLIAISSYVDVGCGSGEAVKIISDSLIKDGYEIKSIKAYDVSPHVRNLKKEGIEFVYGDFCEATEYVNLVTLFDVIEHIPDPVQFIKEVSKKCDIIGFHIPLDNTFNDGLRNHFRVKIRNPGHLVFLDTASAINLLTLSGLLVMDYNYTFSFLSPSGRKSLLSKLIFPFRFGISLVNPYLLSKTLGGASLMVIALTPQGRAKFY